MNDISHSFAHVEDLAGHRQYQNLGVHKATLAEVQALSNPDRGSLKAVVHTARLTVIAPLYRQAQVEVLRSHPSSFQFVEDDHIAKMDSAKS